MTRIEIINKIEEIINTQEDISEAEELAYQNNIILTEIWDENDDEIIGMMIEDITVYF